MNKRPFVPSFLQKLDEKLLLNAPGTWAARTHLVLFFATVFALLLFVFCYFAFFDAKQYGEVGGWNVLVGLIAFVGFVFWLIYLLRFNVFKRYGNWFALDGLVDFGLYFTSIAAMVAVCFVPSAVETMRANQQFGNEEIVKDINEININACRLEYDLLPLAWKFDTCQVVDNLATAPVADEVEVAETMDSTVVTSTQYVSHRYRYIDTAELSRKLTTADSLLKINDSLYVFYECPNYRFITTYNADDHSAVKMLSSAEIYNAAIKNYQAPDRVALLNRMDAFKTKWTANSRYDRYIYYEDDNGYNINDTYEAKISKKYHLNKIGNGIYNAVQKKYAWKDGWPIYLRTFFYIAFYLTLLVFIFRHSTAKTFFLSVLTAVLLTILTGLLLIIKGGDGTSVLSFMLLYYVVFAVLALSIFSAKTRNVAQGIGLNLFLFMTPFIPLIFFALYRESQAQYVYTAGDPNPDRTELYFLIAEIAGPVILLILLQPLFKRLYRKWYAAPEE